MNGLTVEQISRIVQGKLIGGKDGQTPGGAAIDSRKLQAGELFFALKGEWTDGHNYLHEAREKGAVGAVVNYCPAGFEPGEFSLILVDDVTKALQQTAAAMRRLFKGPVAAITGHRQDDDQGHVVVDLKH